MMAKCTQTLLCPVKKEMSAWLPKPIGFPYFKNCRYTFARESSIEGLLLELSLKKVSTPTGVSQYSQPVNVSLFVALANAKLGVSTRSSAASENCNAFIKGPVIQVQFVIVPSLLKGVASLARVPAPS